MENDKIHEIHCYGHINVKLWATMRICVWMCRPAIDRIFFPSYQASLFIYRKMSLRLKDFFGFHANWIFESDWLDFGWKTPGEGSRKGPRRDPKKATFRTLKIIIFMHSLSWKVAQKIHIFVERCIKLRKNVIFMHKYTSKPSTNAEGAEAFFL